MTTKSPVIILREALQIALDELVRVNEQGCGRPDVRYAVQEALQKTWLAPIPDASEIEQRIVGRAVMDLLKADYTISVYDGEETVVSPCKEPEIIFNALASTDSDTLHVTSIAGRRSFVLLIWGNGCDIISDYGISLEDVLKGANELAKELS